MPTRASIALLAVGAVGAATVNVASSHATSASVAAACAPAPIHHGAPPSWSAAAWSDSSAGFKLPYSLASGNSAAAFFWVHLRAGDPTNPANKVLWVMRYPRHGSPLRIVARYGPSPALLARSSWPADSSPGEIYPSYLNLPKPGCWQLTLHWSSHTAHLALTVAAAGSDATAPGRRSRVG
jgi:hypothetical protein